MAKSSRFKGQNQRNSTSKGEKEVAQVLKEMFPFAVFYYEYPYSRFTSTDNNKLRADIYCHTFGFVCEFQGAHHFNPVVYGKTEEEIAEALSLFEERKKLDQLKRNLCSESEIKLIEIDYRQWPESENEQKKFLQDRIYAFTI